MDKRDGNEKELVAFWRSMGCIVIRQDRRAGFDLLVIARNGIHVVECKNPDTAWKLTPDELELSLMVEALGGTYHIVETLRGAAALIGLRIE